MNIDGREIGPDQSTYVIAEIGVNHDGSPQRAAELVRAAREAGADAVKFQVFTGSNLMHASAQFAGYQKDRVAAADPVEMLRQYELSDETFAGLAAEARRCGLGTIATPFSPDDVPRVAAFAGAMKIASPDLINRLLLRKAVDAGLPLIVSTGAATADEIASAAMWLERKAANFALLHCVSSYPTALDEANLCWIGDLAAHRRPVGYSDHTTEISAGALAVMAGADIIEKHLTYDTAASGPDHSASFSPGQFAEYVRQIRIAGRMRGTHGRRVLECEKDVRVVSRQSLVLLRDVRGGGVISADDLTTQRPGTGLSAEMSESIVGMRAARDLKAGQMLASADLKWTFDAA